MPKAIVLTYAPITPEEKELLLKTNIFKIACNWHSEELKPDVRITLDKDETIEKSLAVGNQKVISIRYPYKHKRVVERFDLPKRLSSLISCVDYLYTEGYTDILLIANNLKTNQKDINKDFQKINYDGIESLKDMAYIYRYSSEGVFNCPVLSIKEFIDMKDSEFYPESLGSRKKRLLKRLCFSESYIYYVSTKGKNNKSIETGKLLNTILPDKDKEKILSGQKIIESGDLIIERITDKNVG